MNRLPNRRNKQGRFGWRKLLFLYIILLIASQVARGYHRTPAHPVTERPVVRISSAVDQSAPPDDVIVIYDEHRPKTEGHRAPVLLIDSLSPMSPSVSRDLVSHLSKSGPVIIPDLPAVTASARTIQDHSVHGQASATLALMDHLRIESAHVIAYEMGGPVAVTLADLAPGRVKSLSMVSAVGVQEFELLGSHHINRALYAARLAALWIIQNGTPHMGLLDGLSAHKAQAHVMYESDLRSVRPHLDTLQAPMLILHESPDQRAPAAARELHRIVPQSELILYRQEGRNRPALSRQMVAEIDRFIERVENNRAATRSTATATKS